MNFAAVGHGLDMSESLFAAAFVSDNLSTVPWMLAQVGLFSLLAAYYRSASHAGGSETKSEDAPKAWSETKLSITDLAWLAALPLAFLWIAERVGASGPGQVLCLTTLALVAAQLPIVHRLRGAAVLSYFALHLFFIVIGAVSDVREAANAGPVLFVYMLAISRSMRSSSTALAFSRGSTCRR